MHEAHGGSPQSHGPVDSREEAYLGAILSLIAASETLLLRSAT